MFGFFGPFHTWVVTYGFSYCAEFRDWRDAVAYARLVAVAIERERRVAS